MLGGGLYNTALAAASQKRYSKKPTLKQKIILNKSRYPAEQAVSRKYGKNEGYQISSFKQPELLKKMGLQKEDLILFINKKTIYNKKQFYQTLYPLLKKQNEFQIRLKREGKKISVKYGVIPSASGKKYKLQIFKTMTEPSQKTNQSKNISNQPPIENLKQKTKNLVPEKYKPLMQRAYINRPNSFVYSTPNFDSNKLRSLTIGKQVLITKKIFLPPHGFGSFYKIFLFKKQKIIGYVSEAEVITEFFKENDKYVRNPNYKKAKQYKAENKVLKIEEIEDIRTQRKRHQLKAKTQKKFFQKKYIGLSLGINPYLNSSSSLTQSGFVGLKFSVHSLRLNTDFNFNIELQKIHSDFLIGFPFIKSRSYSLFLMAGVMGDIKYNNNYSNTRYIANQPVDLDYGFTGAVSLLKFLNQSLLLKFELKPSYRIQSQLVSLSFLSSLQIAF